MKKKPLILVTNDDGISAPGIKALIEVMKSIGDVVVIAPDKAQSGMSHAITINSTLRINKTNYHNVLKEYSCSGTPVDCVKIAIHKLLPRKPDLCVSGINHGSNMSISVIYSGTMSAAIEGAIEGIPSIGFSLCNYSIDADFNASKKIVKTITQNVLKNGLTKGTCLNVNIPPVKLSQLKGIKVCRQTIGNWVEELDERKDPSGGTYFWLTGHLQNFEKGNQETDVWAIENNYIAVVPIQFDMTAHKEIASLKKWNYEI